MATGIVKRITSSRNTCQQHRLHPTVLSAVSSTAICSGLSATLSATGASSYTWMPGMATGSSVVVNPTLTTTYTVTGNTAGCNGTSTVQLQVNPLPTVSITATNTNLCTGNTATLTGSGAQTYTWLPGAVVAGSLSVNPAVTTTYSLQGIDAAGCSNTTQITVNVNNTPTVGVTASSTVLCLGEISTLTLSGASTYTTNPGLITGGTITLSPVSTQTYTILGLSGTCQSSAAVTISVNPLPVITASTSAATLCSGASATLTAAGANTYTWLPGSAFGSTTIVTPLSTQIYTVSGTSSISCIGTQTLTQVVTPTPTINIASSSTAVCIGSSATLTASGASNYTWFPSLATGTSIVVSPTNAATYTLVGDNGGTCSQTITTALAVNTLPTLTLSSTPTVICSGSTVTIDALGALNYTWLPSGTGSTSVESPTQTTTYTITGSDINLCENTQTISIVVNSNPTLSAIASPTTICEGGTVTLSVSGAINYTWLPSSQTTSLITETPTITTNYTVSGTDLNGCSNTATVDVEVLSNPVLTLTAASTSICVGQTNTLTVNGGISYTWQPGAGSGSTFTVSPAITTDYSVTASGTNICTVTETITVNVNALPANLTASATATISCGTPSVGLQSASTDTDVVFYWTGPNSFTSAIANPTGIATAGNYTVVFTDTVTGCSDSLVAQVDDDNSIPSLSVTISPSITCNDPAPVIFAANTTTNPGYNWTGPQSFTSTASNPTVTVAGTYTVVLTDVSSGCSDTTSIIVGTHTRVASTATMVAPTCSAGISNNNGTIGLVNFKLSDRFGLVAGATYTATQTYTNASPIPTTGIVTSTIANPIGTALYTLRIFDSLGCTKDSTFIFNAVDCIYRTLGISKAVSVPSLNPDGSYRVTYSVTVRNYDVSAFTQIDLTDNLSAVFPLPTTFTVRTAPVTYSGSGLTLNPLFDGKTQTKLTTAASSSLAAGASESFYFALDVTTPLFYKKFNNTVLGTAVNGASATVADSSNAGFNALPNLNAPTTTSFVPSVLFGLTSEASFVESGLGTYDITYTVTAYNLGNDTLKNVAIRQDFATAIRNPATYTHIKAPDTFGGLVANSGYGTANSNLVDSTTSRINPRSFGRVIFTIRVVPDTQSVILTNAFGSALHQSLANPTVITRVNDISNDGLEPDRDGNLICNEAFDNVPTPVILPVAPDLFVPEGFSPDADGINDRFVIKGMPKNGKTTLTIYNRWGNKVYKADNYFDVEPWDGVPTVGSTPGNGKVTQGTYYYVLEIYTDSVKRLTGYIIVQY
jgi:gliding motility-associated-like protein